MAVTLQQIADHLQISKATVSLSLRNDPLIPPKTRAKIHAAATQLGYESRPRNTSRKNKAKAEGTGIQEGQLGDGGLGEGTQPVPRSLGLLSRAANLNQAREDSSFVQIMQGVMTEAERSGLPLMVNTLSREGIKDNPAAVPVMVREAACSALIVRGAIHPDDIAFLVQHLPVVSIGRIYSDSLVDAVVPDNVAGVRNLVTRLAELGHRRLAWVGADYEATFIEDRQSGFVTGCLQNGLSLYDQRFLGRELYAQRRIVEHNTLVQSVREGTTGMVCANDSIAWQTIHALRSGGIHVPQDVSVTGFDASPPKDGEPRLVSIDPRFAELGRAAVRLALQRLGHRAAPPYVVSVRSEFVPGDTIAVARKESPY